MIKELNIDEKSCLWLQEGAQDDQRQSEFVANMLGKQRINAVTAENLATIRTVI